MILAECFNLMTTKIRSSVFIISNYCVSTDIEENIMLYIN